MHEVEVVLAGLGPADARQQVGDGEPVLLAWPALAARLDGEEARRARCDRDHVDLVVEDDEPSRSEAAPDRGHRFVADRRVELLFGQHGVGDTGGDRLHAVAGPNAPTDELDHVAQRRAHGDFADSRSHRGSRDRAHDGPR